MIFTVLVLKKNNKISVTTLTRSETMVKSGRGERSFA